jgi:ribosomal protein L29
MEQSAEPEKTNAELAKELAQVRRNLALLERKLKALDLVTAKAIKEIWKRIGRPMISR